MSEEWDGGKKDIYNERGGRWRLSYSLFNFLEIESESKARSIYSTGHCQKTSIVFPLGWWHVILAFLVTCHWMLRPFSKSASQKMTSHGFLRISTYDAPTVFLLQRRVEKLFHALWTEFVSDGGNAPARNNLVNSIQNEKESVMRSN